MVRVFTFLLVCIATLAQAQDRNLQVEKGGERRIALVIGNSAYKSSPLKNPVNDARAVAGALRQAGFEVTLKEDLNQRALFEAAREFGNKLKEDGVALFYYAGHGMQVRDRNYLVPVEADIQSELEVPYSSLDVNFVMDVMSRARSRMNLVILDACRNNPFSRSFRSAVTGLAQMDAPGGTLLAYATAPGKVANDGTGDNGLYTQYLLKHLPTPGLPVEIVFKRVREDVEKETKSQQVPWESSSVKGDFFFVPPRLIAQVALAAPAPVVPALDTVAQAEFAFWDSIKSSNSAADYQAYLSTYPSGRFAALARARVAGVDRQSLSQGDSRDQSFWDSIRSSNNPAEYEVYLAQYPKGQYAAIARTRIEQFRRQAAALPPPAPTQGPAPVPVAAAPAFSAESLEMAFWNSIQGTRIVDDYRAYLRQYPNGRFAELAKSRLEQLSAPPIASAAPAVVAPPRPAAPPPTQVASAAPTASSFRVPAGLRAKHPELLPQPGDSWTYRYTDPLNRPAEGNMVYLVTGIFDEGVEESFRRANQRVANSTLTVEPGLRFASHSGMSAMSPDFAPYVQAFGELDEGKTARVEIVNSRWGADGRLFPLDVTVRGEETITVPAGTFRARRIELRGASQVMGIQAGSHQAQAGSGVLRVAIDMWYVPGIKRYVKYVGESSYFSTRLETATFELVSYKVAGSDAAPALAAVAAAAPALLAPVAPVQVASAAPTIAAAIPAGLRAKHPELLPQLGDSWTYRYTDPLNRPAEGNMVYLVTGIFDEGVEESFRRANQRVANSTLTVEPGLRFASHSGMSAMSPDFAPYVQAFGELDEGKTARVEIVNSRWGADGRLFPLDVTVRGEETITVPAGTFRARRIELRGASQVMGIQAGSHQAQAGSGVLRVAIDMWYVPSIKRYVKYVGRTSYFNAQLETSTFELVSYKVAGAPVPAK